MKKHILIKAIVILLLAITGTFAQDPILKKSAVSRSPNGVSINATNFTSVSGFVMDKDGNRYMSGRYIGTNDFDPGSGTVNYTSTNTGASAGYDIFITKLDKNDNLLWVKVIGTAGDNEFVRNMAVDGNGNVIVTGIFREDMDFDPGAGSFTMSNGTTPSDFKALFMLKLDANGDFLWAKNFQANTTGGLVVTVDDMSIDTQNNILCSGYFLGTIDFDPNAGTAIETSTFNVGYFVKISSSGNYVVHKKHGSSSLTTNTNIPSSNIFGRSGVTDASGNIYSLWTFKDNFGTPNQCTAVSKFTSTGTLVWAYQSCLTATSSPTYLKTTLDKLGNVFISADRSVVKINTSTGAALWTKPIVGYQIGIDNNNNIIKTGGFSLAEDFDPGPAYYPITLQNSFSDAFISKMDNNGNFIYAKGLGASGNSNSNAVVIRQNITSYGDIQVWGRFDNSIDVDPSAGTTTLTNTTGASNPGFWATYSLPCTGSPNSSSTTVTACGSYYWATKAVTYTTSGTYTDVLTNAAGCDSTVTLNLTINPLPSINLTNNNGTILTCTNPSTTITASGANSYSWTGTGGFTATTAAATISNIGTYVLTATGTNACTVATNVIITEDKTVPTAVSITPTANVYLTCTNPTLTLTGSGGNTYSWTGPGGFTATTAITTITNIGVYTLTAIGANGCTATATVNIPGNKNPPPLVVTPTSAILTCANSYINLTASGASSYAWTSSTGTFSSTNYLVGITVPATYTVTATGTNGCTIATSVVVTQDITPPTVTITPTTAVVLTCANPSATLTASGGVSYAWTGPATTSSITVTTVNNYNVTVTGANGCTATATKSVTENKTVPSLSLNYSTLQLTCANPTTTVTAGGGSTYAWTGPGGFTATTAAATISVAGTYVVAIIGSNGCTATASVAITESKTPPTINISPTTAILTCVNPTATLTGDGGGTYSWTGPSGFTSTSAIITINNAGTYLATKTNTNNGCTATTSIIITENKVYPTISITPTTAILTCTNPSATLTASGANTYAWTGTGGFTSNTAAATINNVGTYVVTATGTNACTASASVVITENKTVPTVSVTPTSAILTCINPMTTLTASGGNTYSWTGPSGFTSTSATPTVSAGGTYIVTAIGSNGCTATTNAVITENKVSPALTVTPTSAILTCVNQTATLTASGGNSYAWTGTGGFTATTAAITVSNTGTFVVTATGTNACTASVSVAITQSITVPTVSITPATATITLTCANPTTSLTANGGSTYSWTGPSGFTATTATANASNGGTYIVTATGSNGCTATASTTIIDNKVLVVTLGPHNPVINCNFPSRSVTASGGSSYSWTGPGGFTASTPGVSVTVPGTYTVTASNGNGCTGSTSVVFTEDKTPPVATITASRTLLTCTNPSATLTANTTFNNFYSWEAPQGYGFSQQSINTTLAGAGTYTLYIVGANGCGGSTSVVITQNTTPPTISFTPTSAVLTCTNPTTTITASGGSTYSWTSTNTFTSTMATINVSMFGTYTVTATGTNGCVANASVSVTNNTSAPGASIQPVNNTLTCTNPTANLTASGGSTYSWTGPNGFTATSTPVTISSGGIYTLISSGTNGCTATASVNVIDSKVIPTVAILLRNSTTPTMTCIRPFSLFEVVTNATQPTYSWTGPNGFTSVSSFPPAAQAAGVYTVMATNTFTGCTATASITVVDGRTPPTLSVTPTSAVLTCANPSTTLTASGSAGNTYEWTKTTGGFNSSIANPTITTVGTYVVTATGSANGCTATANVVVTENKTLPTPSISSDIASTVLDCINPSRTLTASGGSTYSWIGSSGFTATTAVITVSTAGTYTVYATGTNGCSAGTMITLTDNKTPPTVSVLPASTIALSCTNTNPTLTAIGANTYSWTGSGGFTATTNAINVTTANTYIVTGTGTNGCTATVNVVVTGNTTAPTVSITPATSVLDCNNTSIVLTASGGGTYAWTGTGGFASNTASATINTAGTYIVTITGTNGCTASMSRTITENTTPPTITITPTSTVLNCTNPSLNIMASGGATYKWYFSGILISSSATINVSSPATYLVTTTGANGCTNFKNVTVTENITPPTITLTPTSAILTCANPSTTITASGGSSYSWTGTGGFTATTASATISNAGTYVVTGTGSNGCTASASIVITENKVAPTVSVTGATTVCSGSAVSLNATSNGTTYAWSGPNSYTSTSISPNIPNASVSNSGTYTVTVTNANSCTATATIVVTVNPIPSTPTPQANVSITSGGSISLTATGCTGTLLWFKTSDNSSVTMPVSPTATTNYYAKCSITANNVTCTSLASSNVTVTVNIIVSVISIKTGNWEDPSTWNVGRLPLITEDVTIDNTHTVTITTNNQATAKKVIHKANSILNLGNTTAKLILGN